MRQPLVHRSAAATVLLAALATHPASAATTITVTDNGNVDTFTAPADTIRVTGDAGELTIWAQRGDTFMWATLAPPRGGQLARGIYRAAESTSLRTGRAPGVDAGYDGSGCNEVWGEFAIRQIAFAGGQIKRLDATLTRACGPDSEPLHVDIRYAASPWSFAYTSAAGDDLGQGASRTFLGDTSDMTLYGTPATGLSYGVSGQREDWYITIFPPTGQSLAVGTYASARSADATHAGLSVGGNRRGCSTSPGTLKVRGLRTDTEGKVVSLHATFTIRCDGGPTFSGTIRHFQ